MVTSALPGEGKTSLAASLAACAAHLGRKTLLVDLDLRRPAVARKISFETAAPTTCLVDVLEGVRHPRERDLSRPGHRARRPRRGRPRPRRPGHAAWSRNASRPCCARSPVRYDDVLIDTPPVLGMPDAKALSRR